MYVYMCVCMCVRETNYFISSYTHKLKIVSAINIVDIFL